MEYHHIYPVLIIWDSCDGSVVKGSFISIQLLPEILNSSLYKVRAYEHVSQMIVKMVFSLDLWLFWYFCIMSHFLLDNTKKCDIMQKYHKGP